MVHYTQSNNVENFNMATKTNAQRILESAGIAIEAFEYDCSDGMIDAVSVARKIGKEPERTFKTLVTENPAHQYFVFVIPSVNELDLKKAAKAAGEKSVEMIPSKDLLGLTGYIHGGCSPFGMKKLFPTFLDETAQLFETICVSSGCVGENVSLSPEDIIAVAPAVYAELIR